MGITTASSMMKTNLAGQDKAIKKHQTSAIKRKAATRRFGTRLASRTKRVAATSIAAIPAESIPFLGVAVLIADTGYELYAACETVSDLDQLYVELGMANEVADDDYDLRYFSFCPQESLATWRVGDCIFDEELAQSLDEKGFYTAVFSRPSYRPGNARPECGFTWTSTPPAGDGAGDLNLYNMWIRSALPSPNYKKFAGNILTPDTEEEVMGDYYPRGEYMSVEEFEALGCPSKPAKQ